LLRAKSSIGNHKLSKSIQHSAAPPAGNTTLFQIAERCRPIRQNTSQAQAMLAIVATTNEAREKL
jgi:mannose/fructose/N-acetylgalactosamine-specific phosphotransferase system component IIB